MVDAAGVELDIRSGTGLIPRIPRETKRSNHSIRSNAWVQVQNRYTDLSATRRVEDEASAYPDPFLQPADDQPDRGNDACEPHEPLDQEVCRVTLVATQRYKLQERPAEISRDLVDRQFSQSIEHKASLSRMPGYALGGFVIARITLV